jgi:(p)ppGpp synthase/HD superfamily hydrolase
MLLLDADEAMVAAAWLHDTIEDCGVARQTLATEFGEPVATIVTELTDTTKADFPNLNRAGRKARECERLRSASRPARIIKLLDRIDNLSEKGVTDDGFLKLYARESAMLLEALQGTDAELEAELKGLIS